MSPLPRTAERFIEALTQAETSKDPGPLVELFSEKADLANLALHVESSKDKHEVLEFWTRYLESFKSIRSTFTRKVAEGKIAVLEWEAAGEVRTGAHVEYRGVSILELDESGRISAFRSYYDSAALVSSKEAVSQASVA